MLVLVNLYGSVSAELELTENTLGFVSLVLTKYIPIRLPFTLSIINSEPYNTGRAEQISQDNYIESGGFKSRMLNQ